jgi:hypothetical protein
MKLNLERIEQLPKKTIKTLVMPIFFQNPQLQAQIHLGILPNL